MTETNEATVTGKSPSGYRIEQAIAAWQSARSRLLEGDADLAKDETALTELLGEEAGDVKSILLRLIRGAIHAEAMAKSAHEQLEVLKGRQDRFKARGQAMRSTAYQMMEAIGEIKIEEPDFTCSIRKSPPSAMIVDEDAIPDVYIEVVTIRKIDKTIILADLKAGREIPGAFLNNGLTSISIRTK